MKQSLQISVILTALITSNSAFGATLYFEDFDGNTNGYNPVSTTAVAGDNDWVDFNNRMTSDSYTTASGGTESVLAGTSNGNDPQIRTDFALGIDKSSVQSFSLRIRIDKDNANGYDDALVNEDFNVFWGSTAYGNPGATNIGDTNINLQNPTTLVAQADGWHLATWQIPSGGLTAGANPNVQSIRIDPANGPAGVGDTFEIDYFEITGVPEPGSTTLLALCAIAAGFRRHRR